MKKLISVIAIIASLFISVVAQSDASLAKVTAQDKAERLPSGQLPTLTVGEHAYRADVYSANRHFPEARAHWQKIFDNYPTDGVIAKALMGTGRSFMWERQYAKAIPYFEKAHKDFPFTKEGRESLAFKGACHVRLGNNLEAVKAYELYTTMYPTGEKIESSHLNIIDAYREARKYTEAYSWVEKTRGRFAGMPSEMNALFAQLRMEFYRGDWNAALKTADLLLQISNFQDSMTSRDEVTYLKAYTLEKLNRRIDAIAMYSAIPNTMSYYSGLASERLAALKMPRVKPTGLSFTRLSKDYPAPYKDELLRHAKSRGVDPRFVLAVMKQESSFRANAKSPAAARGLLQLVYDTAIKYNKTAGFPLLEADHLYQPNVNIAIGSVYMADLKKQFGGLYEAVAASYNGGEDNAQRWLNRANPKEPAVFTAEVGFAESKNYVFKVMSNYRVYRELYTEDLRRK